MNTPSSSVGCIRWALALCVPLVAAPVAAQGLTCGLVVSQLQQYVAQVNQAANTEYHRNIPYRCGGNQQCMMIGIQQLNGWYLQQSNMVNGWYQQILANCSNNQNPNSVIGEKRNRNSAPKLDEEDVASIDVDDEDKTVRIRIPSTPSGYR